MTPSNLPPNGGVRELFILTRRHPALTVRGFYPIFNLTLEIQNALLSIRYLPY